MIITHQSHWATESVDVSLQDPHSARRLSVAEAAELALEGFPELTYRVISWSGPGGGAPTLRVAGPVDQLELFLDHHYEGDVP